MKTAMKKLNIALLLMSLFTYKANAEEVKIEQNSHFSLVEEDASFAKPWLQYWHAMKKGRRHLLCRLLFLLQERV